MGDFNDEIDFGLWGLDNSDISEGKGYMWYGKYYLVNNDLEYYGDNYYSIAGDGTVSRCQYGRITDGKYYMFRSDRNDYDFRILFSFDNGDEYLMYGKSNIPQNDSRRDQRDDITFYMYTIGSENLDFYGRYLNETYMHTEAAIRSANR